MTDHDISPETTIRDLTTTTGPADLPRDIRVRTRSDGVHVLSVAPTYRAGSLASTTLTDAGAIELAKLLLARSLDHD